MVSLVRRPPSARRQQKFIIQFGSVRTPQQVLDEAYEQQTNTFFGGEVLRAQYIDPVLGLANLDQEISRSYAIPYDLLAPSLAIAQATNFFNYSQNFLRLNVAEPGTTDIFSSSDFAALINNIRVGARYAYEAGFAGVLLDMEAYSSSPLWDYTALSHAHTFAEYQAQLLSAGREAIQAIEQEWRYGIVQIVIAVSYEQLKDITTQPALEAYRYGLLPKFLDGLHDYATKARLTCMNEDSYANQTAADFDHDIQLQTPPDVPWLGSTNYTNVHLDGLSTWLDYPGTGFDFDEPVVNYNRPEQFALNLQMMLERVDRYCFVYTQQPRWPGWGESATDRTPQKYIDVVNNMLYNSAVGRYLVP